MKANKEIQASGTGHWFTLIGKFLAGQGAVQSINFISGFLIIRFLSISEYALYTIASLLLLIGSLGSDFGLSQALNTLGAKIKDDRKNLGALYSGAYRYRQLIYPASVCAILLVAAYMMYGKEWSLASVVGTVILIVLTSWIQQPVSLKKAILNIHHDSAGLLNVGLSEALSRLLTIAALLIWPTAVTALIVNLTGILAGRYFLSKRCIGLMSESELPDASQLQQLRKFIWPLAPGVIYYMLQGQISVFLLSLYGNTASIAEVGALGRLGQIVGLLMLLNAFMIQPYFARIEQKSVYIRRVILVVAVLLSFSIISMISVYWVPEWWLFILGSQYAGLAKEIPLTVLGSLLSLAGSTLYTMVIARKRTNGQFWYIVFGLGSQIIFLSIFDVRTTYDALILNALPTLAYILVQVIMLLVVINTWKISYIDQAINAK